MKFFQAQTLEVHTKIEAGQHKFISKVEIIQNYFQKVSQSFDSILLKEKEAKVAQTTFQKAAILSAKEEVSKTEKLFDTEKIGGDIMLKVWEANIVENKRITKEVKDNCEELFNLLDKGSLGIGRDNFPRLLGQINIERH